LLTVLCSLLICSCPSPLTQTSPKELPQGFGSFSLSVNTQRTILPGIPALTDFAVYTLAFTAVSGGENKTEDRTNAQLASSPVVLAAGTYSLTVRAYKDAEKTRLAARGTLANIEITSGATVSQTVILKAIGNEGSGTFGWNINITASGVTGAGMAIKRNDAHISGSPFALNTSGVSTGSLTLDSGVYNIRFTLEKDAEEEAVWNEVLYVYAELTSDFSIIFDDDFFYRTRYNVIFVYNNGDTDGSQSVEHGGIITRPGDPARTGYTFGGWYTDAALTAPYDDFNAPVYNDFSLYAKWAPITFNFYDEVAAYATAAENKTIIVPSNITLDKIVTIPANTSGATLTITGDDGGPYTLSREFQDTDAGSGLFMVESNARLILKDIIVDGNKDNYTTNSASLVRVNSGGTFTMESGAVLQNNNGSDGNVYINGGTFSMTGGEITGNISANAGGGVYVNGGTFTMNGGEISGNASTINGGGVYYSDGVFRLGGTAKIRNNTKAGDSSPNNAYLADGKYIAFGTGIIGEATPAPGMEIYINYPAATGSVIVNNGATAEYAAYFFTDDDAKEIVYRLNGSDGQLVLADKGSAGITLSVEQIKGDIPLPVADGITLSRSDAGGFNKQEIITIDLDDYDSGSVKWEIFGAGNKPNITETNTDTFTLDAANINYNSLGGHTLRLTVKIDGVPYMVNINFTTIE
jgi:uncharacterized repeat protein (TIGR02543 family)